jgi:hypothetical protein
MIPQRTVTCDMNEFENLRQELGLEISAHVLCCVLSPLMWKHSFDAAHAHEEIAFQHWEPDVLTYHILSETFLVCDCGSQASFARTHVHTHTHTHMDTYPRAQVYDDPHQRTHTHSTRIYRYIHTRSNTYTHTHSLSGIPLCSHLTLWYAFMHHISLSLFALSFARRRTWKRRANWRTAGLQRDPRSERSAPRCQRRPVSSTARRNQGKSQPPQPLSAAVQRPPHPSLHCEHRDKEREGCSLLYIVLLLSYSTHAKVFVSQVLSTALAPPTPSGVAGHSLVCLLDGESASLGVRSAAHLHAEIERESVCVFVCVREGVGRVFLSNTESHLPTRRPEGTPSCSTSFPLINGTKCVQ